MKRKYLFLLLASILVLTGCNNSSQSASVSSGEKSSSSSSASSSSILSSTSSSSSSQAVKGEVYKASAEIAANATRDGVSTTQSGLLAAAGYDGSEKITKTKALNLLYRAYKDHMPEMTGLRKYGAYVMSTPYADIPSEASEAAAFLAKYGLLSYEYDASGNKVTSFSGDEDFTALLPTYIDRFHGYFGTSLVDDFANTVNSDFAYNTEAFKDKSPDEWAYDTKLVSQSRINSWIASRISEMPASSEKTAIDNYTESYESTAKKVAGDCDGAFPAYQSILNATTFTELFDTCASLFKAQGTDPLFASNDISSEVRIGNKISPIFESFSPASYVSSDFTEGSQFYTSHKGIFNTVFSGVGFSDTISEQYSSAALKAMGAIRDYYVTDILGKGIPDTYGLVTTSEVVGKENFSLYDHLNKADFTLTPFTAAEAGAPSSCCRAVITNNGSYTAFLNAMDDTLLDGYKAIVLYQEINLMLPCNPLKAVTALDSSLTSFDYLKNNETLSKYYDKQVEDYLIAYYKETPSYRNNVAVITKAITEIRSEFNNIIDANTWISSEGKASAKAKVNKVKSLILANNDNGTGLTLFRPEFKADSLYANMCNAKNAVIAYGREHSDTTSVYDIENIDYHFKANAFYNPASNSIIILFGYLAAHNDFASMSTEQLYSELYLCCGHELTHGFDTNGVKFDENGNVKADWLNAADNAAYQERVQNVINYYNGYEVMPGLATNGNTVISEACADIAGTKIVVNLARKVSGFDFDKFFRCTGQSFYSVASQYVFMDQLANDTHPFGRVRANRMLSSIPEFYATYNIVEGDGMYVAPDKRPNVW